MPASGPARDTPLPELQQIAKSLRRRMLAMAAHKGEGYIAQGLGIADALAVVYFRELALDAARFDDPDRDRFILSTGHYSIALYAVLAELGVLTDNDLDDYALNESRLPMSTFDETPGVEVTSGSLGQGLGQAVGMALGLRLDGSSARVMVELSDGEMQEGSTWEAAAAGCGAQHDRSRAGPLPQRVEPDRKRLDVVAVNLRHRPAERLPLGGDRFEPQDQPPVRLDAVAVDQRPQLVQPEAGGGRGGLPR